MEPQAQIPVLIVGGGPVGLGLAIDLARRGIACTLVDARDGTVGVPKMTQVTWRSMEFCRQWGIAEAVVQAGYPVDLPYDFAYVSRLRGYQLARSCWPPFAAGAERGETPHGTVQCAQIFFDPILQRRAASDPRVTLRYHTTLLALRETADGVVARLRDGTSEFELASRFVVGCDGAESTVRTLLGIGMEGAGKLSTSLSVFFRSEALGTLHDKGWARFYRLVDEGGNWADLVSIDGRGLWRLTVLGIEDSAEALRRDVPGMLRRAVGCDVPHEVISVTLWERRDQVALSYGRGAVFLAGDAAHLLSPTGGLGMNTGLADAVDLSWKLAAMLAGWGGPGLAASYEAERRPVARRNVDESTAYFRRTRIFPRGEPFDEAGPAGDAARAAFRAEFARLEASGELYISEHVKNGYTYEASPLCVADGTGPIVPRGIDYVPNARPGARAPHLWLADGRSLLDLFGGGFVLLRLDPASRVEALQNGAAERGIPLAVHDIVLPGAAALYQAALVLVRPDGHVAWRGDVAPDGVWRRVTGWEN